MVSDDRPHSARDSRRDRIRQRQKSDKELALVLSIGGGAVALLIFLVIVITSGPAKPPAPPQAPLIIAKPDKPVAGVDDLQPLPVEDRELILKGHRAPDPAESRKLSAREIIDNAYKAAQRRAEIYSKDGRWGDAIKAMTEVADHFEDDHELTLRTQQDIDALREQATAAYKARRAEADRLVDAGKYDEARDLLLKLAETFGVEESVEDAKKRAQEIFDRKWAEAEADYRRQIAPVNADILEWKFDEALAGASKLAFRYEKYQKLLAARIDRIRGLIVMKKKMMDKVNGALPRLQKRALRMPGLEGEVTDATLAEVTCETERGKEKFPWTKIGPEATLRLALLAGKEDDPQHRIGVARLLVEVGYLKRARAQLELAQRLGVDTAADLADLDSRAAADSKD